MERTSQLKGLAASLVVVVAALVGLALLAALLWLVAVVALLAAVIWLDQFVMAEWSRRLHLPRQILDAVPLLAAIGGGWLLAGVGGAAVGFGLWLAAIASSRLGAGWLRTRVRVTIEARRSASAVSVRRELP